MSNLNHYVRQLRPRTESYTPHVDMIQDLFMVAEGGQGGLDYETKSLWYHDGLSKNKTGLLWFRF